MQKLHSTRDEKIIFFASCATKLFFVGMVVFVGGFFQPFSTVQSDGYLPLATNLYQLHAFTYSTTTPFVPEALQVPLYPLFLAIAAVPFHSIIPALLVQVLLMSLSAVFLYRLTEGFFSRTVRLWASLLYAVEPFAGFIAASALSEALFMCIFLLGLLMLRRAFENNSLKGWAFAGLLLGASVLVRPIGMYLAPLLLVFVAFVYWRRTGEEKKVFPYQALLIGLICFALLPSVWAARNFADFGIATVATKGPYTLYFFDVQQLLEYRDNLTPAQADQVLFTHAQADNAGVRTHEDLRNPHYASYLRHASLAYIKQSPLLYAKIQILSLITFFFSDGYRLLLEELGVTTTPLPNITKAVAHGQFGLIGSYLLHNPLEALVFMFGTLLWGAVTLLALCSPYFAWRQRAYRTLFILLLFAFFIAYFAILTGPVAQARYRVVIEPFIFTLAVYAFSQMMQLRHRFYSFYLSR